MKVSIVIPARYASTRFPGKPLVTIRGKTMIERVYAQALKSRLAAEVLVATDDDRIAQAVRRFGGKAVMTRSDHPSGTDRLAEVARRFQDMDIVVNVQGDEPLIDPEVIDRAIEPVLLEPGVQMATLASLLEDSSSLTNPSVVKVVVDRQGNALYFSRQPIPYYRDSGAVSRHLAHAGLYVYRRETLLQLAALEPTELERAEALEQLRALEHGIKIRVVTVEGRTPAVDTPEDLALVEDFLDRQAPLVAASKITSLPLVSH